MKLTQAFVRRAKCEKDKSKQVFYDDTLKGFILEVKPTGRKTFYLRHITEEKKTKYTKLGDASILPVSDARTKAIKLKRSLEEGKDVKYIIPFLLLTGARRGEVLQAQWSDIDLHHNLWTIPTSKSGKKRILPISESLKELIATIPNTSKYLFPSPKTGKPQLDFFSSWNRARIKAGLKDVRIHDLRHSFASALVNSGRSLYEVQTLLGHSNMKMTQRYAHLNNENLMKAVSCAGRLLE